VKRAAGLAIRFNLVTVAERAAGQGGRPRASNAAARA
jgi:hypothetical protein